MNRINQTGQLRLFSIQIGWNSHPRGTRTSSDDSDDQQTQAPWPRLRFEYITEVIPKISNFSADKLKPGYFNVLSQPQDSETAFYFYTGIGRHTLVYKQMQATISTPKLDADLQLQAVRDVLQPKESMLSKDADTILRQIDEDSAKEQQELA